MAGARYTGHRKQNRGNNNLSPEKVAALKGVVALRRGLSPKSRSLMRGAREELRSEFPKTVDFFDDDSIFVTQIGFNRLYRKNAPRSQEIIQNAESCQRPVGVQLGRLAIFGNKKLAFHLDAPQLKEEVAELESEYRDQDYKLGTQRDNRSPQEKLANPAPKNGFIPHCTIGKLDRRAAAHFEEYSGGPDQEGYFDEVAGVVGNTILLESIRIPEIGKH